MTSLVLASPASLCAGAGAGSPAPRMRGDRALPMQFELRQEGPPETCGSQCRALISAVGRDHCRHPDRDFYSFADGRDLNGATVVLDSDGGSVLGAMALGREIRALRLATTVRSAQGPARHRPGAARARRCRPRADCESMCAFVLLAGVQRTVPAEARVMVHQIWLGDRRDDPTAANYSAEDLVLVQRDIGRLARYTAEMGAGRRSFRPGAAHSAVGADARAHPRRASSHPTRYGRAAGRARDAGDDGVTRRTGRSRGNRLRPDTGAGLDRDQPRRRECAGARSSSDRRRRRDRQFRALSGLRHRRGLSSPPIPRSARRRCGAAGPV